MLYFLEIHFFFNLNYQFKKFKNLKKKNNFFTKNLIQKFFFYTNEQILNKKY